MSDVDEIAVERAVRGDRTVPLTRAELFAAFAVLNRRGHSARVIGEILGVSARTVFRWRGSRTVPNPGPAYRRWSAPVWTCGDCGATMTANFTRHRRRHHSGVSA